MVNEQIQLVYINIIYEIPFFSANTKRQLSYTDRLTVNAVGLGSKFLVPFAEMYRPSTLNIPRHRRHVR